MNARSGQSLGRKLAYSGGSLAAAVSGQVIGFYLLYFYVDIIGLPLTYYKLGMVIYAIWNALNDPLAGHISDRTRSRWGRRIPYIRYLSLPLAISFALVWTPPAGLSHTGLFAYFIAVLFVFDTLFTFVVLNWTALFPEMYPSLDERSQVSALRQLMGLVGLVVGVALAPMLYSSLGWTNMGVVLAVVIAAGMYISLLGSFERPEIRGGESIPLGPALRHTFTNRSFITFVLASLLIQFCFGVMSAAMPLYAKYVLGVPDAQVTLLWAGIFGSAFVMLFLWQWITRRLAPRKSTLLAIVLFGVALAPFLYLTDLSGALAAVPFIGLGLAGLMMLIDVLIADVIDEDQVKTGTRREGMYFGMNGFVIRLSIALQGLVIGTVLQLGNYAQGLAQQPPEAIQAMRALMTVVPWVGLAAAFLAVWFHSLDGRRLEELKAEVARVQGGTPASG